MNRIWRKTVKIAIALTLTLGLLLVVGCSTDEGPSSETNYTNISNQQEGIFVSGVGKVTLTPDIVNLNLGIQVQQPSVSQAQADAAQAMNSVMDVLKTNGVAEKDIQTQHFSIQKITRWDDKNQKEITIGYLVTNLVNAKIRTTDKVGSIIDAVAAAGGDYTQINGISFSVDKPENYYGDARELAMADAKEKATQLASLSDVRLGKPTYISEGSHSPVPPSPIVRPGVPSESPTPISPGQMEITLTVQVVYAISK